MGITNELGCLHFSRRIILFTIHINVNARYFYEIYNHSECSFYVEKPFILHCYVDNYLFTLDIPALKLYIVVDIVHS